MEGDTLDQLEREDYGLKALLRSHKKFAESLEANNPDYPDPFPPKLDVDGAEISLTYAGHKVNLKARPVRLTEGVFLMEYTFVLQVGKDEEQVLHTFYLDDGDRLLNEPGGKPFAAARHSATAHGLRLLAVKGLLASKVFFV